MNLPNKLTLSRIVLSPVFMVFLLADGLPFLYIAFFLFLTAALTDIFDGYLARKTGVQTSFGKLMDPFADKLLISLALVGLLARGAPGLPGWMVVVIIGRELVVTGFRSLAAYRGLVIAASRMAQLKTVFQMVLVGWILGQLTFLGRIGWVSHAGIVQDYAVSDIVLFLLLWSTVVLTLVSGLDYLVRNRAVLGSALR
ncbi:MAG: CDP-diacylglycerol--glycerol-3-phosphate 3-phosphatidyltransferase [Candidatus Eisenbacteria sp.]|nr:CDP-diacylglycerol--glycerol-3-phosphate 3-phosphatidyltransferase [Candidatus Eisenbacteria bacterium]